jgi:hypothetical protein
MNGPNLCINESNSPPRFYFIETMCGWISLQSKQDIVVSEKGQQYNPVLTLPLSYQAPALAEQEDGRHSSLLYLIDVVLYALNKRIGLCN